MLDAKSIDVISRFKLALLVRAQQPARPSDLPRYNRGNKLPSAESNPHALSPKVVEYGGSHHLVLTNEVVERTNYRNKRRWRDFHRSQRPGDAALADEGLGSDLQSGDLQSDASDDDSSEENPLKRMRLGELLAPLAHPAELASHPAISKTYRLASLAVLAAEIIGTIETEQNTLNHYNKLLQVLDGEDWFYQLEENMGLPLYDHGLDDTPPAASPEHGEDRPVAEPEEFENKRITRAAGQPDGAGAGEVTDPFFALPKSLEIYERLQQRQLQEAAEEDDEYGALQQELINYLQVSIQRQNEYIKNLTTIRNGLVKADRYKRDLLRWGKEMGERK
ncbi:hypothetical protein METBIDRAFT_34744 [Metschnikowia bicuspidata var. bicuspidata NRRL YB-4993]|uniref:Transcriptional regulatory protein RXT2 N-terminal domain-containing protein n=1 Tax=Metschnikowia bicuspidata var. bicuspidata NRRL YB-4993 TaxID=869754 RepID=A0A1A0HGF8_9ASCO|nr:hypothetical protein METBIDRAFT_34744 [Metschnikowia bicuspidata var. bicuspidata NRRL YB-4993]OBA22938.1 hypothetical protein METBIDRAFT_34744 [Metschnikowia bicuspidata var. bicuspidata NRRL YB-4993]